MEGEMEEKEWESSIEDKGKFDDEVMNLEFKKYTGKKKKSKAGSSSEEKGESSSNDKEKDKEQLRTAKPVNQRGKVTREQMLTAPHSPYFEVRVGQAVFLRQAANDDFAADKIDDAIKLYERALYHCDFSDSKVGFEQTEEQKQSLQEATDPIYLNLARCYLKKKEYRKAITNSRSSIHNKSSELNKTKARYLEGKALYGLKEYDNALKILEMGAESINDEIERKENTNLLQQSILQSDYQDLIQLVREGQTRHKVHDAKVWGGLLKKDEGTTDRGKVENTKSEDELSLSSLMPLLVIGVLMLFVAIYFAS